jgi:hypothetical protein
VRAAPLELVERFAIAGFLEENPDDAACSKHYFRILGLSNRVVHARCGR